MKDIIMKLSERIKFHVMRLLKQRVEGLEENGKD